jgi:hypothetical protein
MTTATRERLWDGQIFEHRGYRFRVSFAPDPDLGEPWREHDGHGIVSEWTTRDKRPGERVLATDRHHRRFYDVEATTAIARRDHWGCGDPAHTHATTGERVACAVDRDFEYCRDWCTDRWYWCSVGVTLLDYAGPEHAESLSGIESDADDYLTTVAYELADEIHAQIEVAEPNVQLSEN